MSSLSNRSRLANDSKQFNEYLSQQEILEEIKSYQEKIFYLKQDAEVSERFLRGKWPQLLGLERVETTTESARSSVVQTALIDVNVSFDSSLTCSQQLSLKESQDTILSRMPARLSVTRQLKMSLVDRLLEEGGMSMEKLKSKFTTTRFLLVAEEENLRSDLEEIETVGREFEDNLNSSIMKDKFRKNLESELELRDRQLKKLRLNVNSLKVEYKRVKSQQSVKMEFREKCQPIDMKKIAIEKYKNELELIEKTEKLSKLKMEIARKGSLITSKKLQCNDISLKIKTTKKETRIKEGKYKLLEEHEAKNSNQLNQAKHLFEQIQNLSTIYKSPDVQSYIELEAALDSIRKQINNLKNRCSINKCTITVLGNKLTKMDSLQHQGT